MRIDRMHYDIRFKKIDGFHVRKGLKQKGSSTKYFTTYVRMIGLMIFLLFFISPFVQAEGTLIDPDHLLTAEEAQDIEHLLQPFSYPLTLRLAERAEGAMPDWFEGIVREQKPQDNAIVILYIDEDHSFWPYVGDAWVAHGYDTIWLKDKLNQYASPALKSDGLSRALTMLLYELPADLPWTMDGASPASPEHGLPNDPAAQNANHAPTPSNKGLGWIGFIAIAVFVLMLISFIFLLFYRRKLRHEVHVLKTLLEHKEKDVNALSAHVQHLKTLREKEPANVVDAVEANRHSALEHLLDQYQKRLLPDMLEVLEQALERLNLFRVFAAAEDIAYVKEETGTLQEFIQRVSKETRFNAASFKASALDKDDVHDVEAPKMGDAPALSLAARLTSTDEHKQGGADGALSFSEPSLDTRHDEAHVIDGGVFAQDASFTSQTDEKHHRVSDINAQRIELQPDFENLDVWHQRLEMRLSQMAAQSGMSFQRLRALLDDLSKQRETLVQSFAASIQEASHQNTRRDADLQDGLNVRLQSYRESLAALERAYQKLEDEMLAADRLIEMIEVRLPEAMKALEMRYQGIVRKASFANAPQIERELKAMKSRWHALIPLWAEGAFDVVEHEIQIMQSSLETLHAWLDEEEALRRGVDQALEQYAIREEALRQQFSQFIERNKKLERLMDMAETDLSSTIRTFEKALANVQSQRKLCLQYIEEARFQLAWAVLETIQEAIHTLDEQAQNIEAALTSLEGFEKYARTTLRRLDDRLREIEQHMARRFLTAEILAVDEARDAAERALDALRLLLDRFPLPYSSIQEAMAVAETSVDQYAKQATETLEDASYAEAVIHRLNRFRLHDPHIGRYVMQAENCFRDHAFKKARFYAEKAWHEAEKRKKLEDHVR